MVNDDSINAAAEEVRILAVIAGREAATSLYQLIVEEEQRIRSVGGVAARDSFLGTLRELLTPPSAIVEPVTATSTRPRVPQWYDAIIFCAEITSDCRRVPAAGATFAASVICDVEDVCVTIWRTKHVTAAQQEALQNWHAGILRWLGSTS